VGRDRLKSLPLWIVICGLGATQIIGWGTTYYALGALSQDIAAASALASCLFMLWLTRLHRHAGQTSV